MDSEGTWQRASEGLPISGMRAFREVRAPGAQQSGVASSGWGPHASDVPAVTHPLAHQTSQDDFVEMVETEANRWNMS